MNSVEEMRSRLTTDIQWFYQQSWHKEAIQALAEARKLKPETLSTAGAFFIPDDVPNMIVPEYLKTYGYGLWSKDKFNFAGRLVYPVRDSRNLVMGFCAWDRDRLPKYLDSHTYGYKAKASTFYGQEMLPLYYTLQDPVFVHEGIVDTLWIREQGLCGLAALTSSLSNYQKVILSRMGRRVVIVADNDEAGDVFVNKALCMLPKAQVIQPALAKDTDDMRKLDDISITEITRELKEMNNPLVPLKYYIRRR